MNVNDAAPHIRRCRRHDVNQCEIAVEVVLQHDVEVRILRTGAVIGQVQGLLGERVQIGRLPIVAAAARVLTQNLQLSTSWAGRLLHLSRADRTWRAMEITSGFDPEETLGAFR